MKIKLFNGALTHLSLTVAAGGYDPESGRVTLVVQGDAGQAGTILLDVTEAGKVAAMLTTGLPNTPGALVALRALAEAAANAVMDSRRMCAGVRSSCLASSVRVA